MNWQLPIFGETLSVFFGTVPEYSYPTKHQSCSRETRNFQDGFTNKTGEKTDKINLLFVEVTVKNVFNGFCTNDHSSQIRKAHC